MGAYALLDYGDFHVWEFKTAPSFESMLLFSQEDLVIAEEVTDDGKSRQTCKFITTAQHARRRVDARGLDLGYCKRAFEDLRPNNPEYFRMRFEKSRLSIDDLDFDWYLDTLDRIYEEKEPKHIPVSLGHAHEWEDDPDAKLVALMLTEPFSLNFDAARFFHDVILAVYLRSLLEVVPSDTRIEMDFTELVLAGCLYGAAAGELFDSYKRLMLRRIEADYKLYGFIVMDDPNVEMRLRERIGKLDEDQFIAHVLRPLLKTMEYEHVRIVEYHGRGEFGKDILPFRTTTPFGTLEYYAVQAKATRIHGTSAREGNAGELISQAAQAFKVTFVDTLDNERKRIDKFVIATNKAITASARKCIEEGLEGNRSLIFLDIDRIVDLVKEQGLVQYLLFSELW